MSKVEIDMNMNPLERLKKETELHQPPIKYLGMVLLDKFENDPEYLEKYKTKTLESCYQALEDYARTNNKMCIDDKEALNIVLDYICDIETKPFNSYTLTVEDEEEMKARALEEFKEREIRRLDDLRIEKEKKEQEQQAAKQKIEQEKYDKLAENQVSIFDL